MKLGYDPLQQTTKYRTIREIGRGAMGEVFLAEHATLGTKVVVKVLHERLANQEAVVDRMRLEAQALARLNHPNIVRVTDFDKTPEGRHYFVMEYLPGRTLREEMTARGGFLPVEEAIHLARQALAGLGAAHEAGLLHRDVKLDNIFVCDAAGAAARAGQPGPVAKLLDFGVAKVLDTAALGALDPLAVPTSTGVVVGTPRFFAPEQALGRQLDHRVDLYAAGLVLYAMLAGRGPFDEATNATAMAKAHVAKPPDPPSRFASQPIPADLDAAVLRALAKNPDERWPSAAAFSAELEHIANLLAAGTGTGAAASPAPADGGGKTVLMPAYEEPAPGYQPPAAGWPAGQPAEQVTGISDLELAATLAAPDDYEPPDFKAAVAAAAARAAPAASGLAPGPGPVAQPAAARPAGSPPAPLAPMGPPPGGLPAAAPFAPARPPPGGLPAAAPFAPAGPPMAAGHAPAPGTTDVTVLAAPRQGTRISASVVLLILLVTTLAGAAITWAIIKGG